MQKLLDPKEADKGSNKSAPVKHIFIKVRPTAGAQTRMHASRIFAR